MSSRQKVGLIGQVNLGQLRTLLLGERDFAAEVVDDDDLVGAVVNFHGRTAALDSAELGTGDGFVRDLVVSHG